MCCTAVSCVDRDHDTTHSYLNPILSYLVDTTPAAILFKRIVGKSENLEFLDLLLSSLTGICKYDCSDIIQLPSCSRQRNLLLLDTSVSCNSRPYLLQGGIDQNPIQFHTTLRRHIRNKANTGSNFAIEFLASNIIQNSNTDSLEFCKCIISEFVLSNYHKASIKSCSADLMRYLGIWLITVYR